ncbi:MAG: cytochrome c-type biogenesis protein CcmH [Oleispira sp.]|jgi:cytochrome c-type biogenesis protein CcmH
MKLILALFLSLFTLTSQAVVDGHKYPFDNDVDKGRFEVLAEELRCPKCQNQNLADSNAPVASDLRDKVYELMIEGQTDDQIVSYLVARYGDFVRYNPPVQKNTFFLWFGPGVMVLIGLIIIINLTRSSKKSQPLSDEENVKLAALKAARSEKQDS